MPEPYVTLPRHENQALGLGQFAIDFLAGRLGEPGEAALARVELFHLDSVACAVAALACGANAPRVLREEAREFLISGNTDGARSVPTTLGAVCFGSQDPVRPEKAIVANCSAVREWDSNGTNFGYNPARATRAGEFGHNDFYPVAVAAAQMTRAGRKGDALRAWSSTMRSAAGWPRSSASRPTRSTTWSTGRSPPPRSFGAMLGATAEQIESAIGMTVAHYIPFRAIRAGKQLSDSKGASAAISTEFAVLSVQAGDGRLPRPARHLPQPRGDLLRSSSRPRQRTPATQPLRPVAEPRGRRLRRHGHALQAGALRAPVRRRPPGCDGPARQGPDPARRRDRRQDRQHRITAYEPAFGIIGDPAKRDPTHAPVRRSLDGLHRRHAAPQGPRNQEVRTWTELMLTPDDYHDDSHQPP
jgi:2-methylcitrate dehydratase